MKHVTMPVVDPEIKQRPFWRALIDPDGPWVWLLFLPFYAFPWLFVAPTTFALMASAIGIAAFLALYLVAGRTNEPSPLLLIGIMAVAAALAPVGANWSVIAIYAAAIAGKMRPARQGIMLIGFVCIAIVITGIALGHYTIWWGPAVLLSALTGGSNISATALKEKNSQLLRAQDEVRTLSRTAERERIGRDLHDLLGRTLTLIAVKADLTERLATRDPDAAIQEVRELGDAAREALRDVRNALSGAREAGLVQELGAARAMLESADITMRIEGDPALVPCGPGGVLGMAIREAVTNVVRHAEATDCTIAIQRMAQCASVVITDTGRGGSFAEGVGLKGMRARLSAAGGTLEIMPQPCGTRLVARVPVV
ncbi:MAG: sensor histidine kinase [Alteraurantiacibacter sp.]